MAVLSIQSHVAYGHVGNSAATFPLQRLGHEVWAMPTMIGSNHLGHGIWAERSLAPDALAELLDPFVRRGVLVDCAALLSGYLWTAALGDVVLAFLARARAVNPRLLYCCDPVIGDRPKGAYVKAGIAELLRERAIPAADLVTPNHFELEHLAGCALPTLPDLLAAAHRLAVGVMATAGPRLVLVTGIERADGDPTMLETVLVAPGGAWRLAHPRLDTRAKGTGDAMAAIFVARLLTTGDAPGAMRHAASALHAVLAATVAADADEMCLVAAQDAIVAPPVLFPIDQVA